ncbi:SDR family NAD(P)-dependent oxidoreductase [Thermodesulfobacteriota bacterium]
MGKLLEGKCAVVTGSGGGIGKAIAIALAAHGASVVVNDYGGSANGIGYSSKPANEVVDEIKREGGVAVPNYDTVADYKSAANIIQTCTDNFGKIDILVNCAGIIRWLWIYEYTEEDWDSVIDVHLKGTFNCARHASVLMQQQKSGRIINFTSEGWLGGVLSAAYCAAKGGIVSFSKAVAKDMAIDGITCNVVCPRATTRLGDNDRQVPLKLLEVGYLNEEKYKEVISKPRTTPYPPEAVAPIAVYLSSEYASNINGKVFWSEGGKISLFSDPDEVKSIYKEGIWTQEELIKLMPKSLSQNLKNRWVSAKRPL